LSRRPEPPRIYALADAEALAPTPVNEGVARMAMAGVRWIQVRAKRLEDRELCLEIERSLRALESFEVDLWINDRADLASFFAVLGLHVGQGDLAPGEARKVVGDACWIGRSTHTQGQLDAAVTDPTVDVVAVGPVFETSGKRQPDPVVGLELVRWARARTDKPLVAIGGIGPATIDTVLEAGADSVALLGAVCRGDLGANLRQLGGWL
jgi:thiamine-phosphate pyrophosphorylase